MGQLLETLVTRVITAYKNVISGVKKDIMRDLESHIL